MHFLFHVSSLVSLYSLDPVKRSVIVDGMMNQVIPFRRSQGKPEDIAWLDENRQRLVRHQLNQRIRLAAKAGVTPTEFSDRLNRHYTSTWSQQQQAAARKQLMLAQQRELIGPPRSIAGQHRTVPPRQQLSMAWQQLSSRPRNAIVEQRQPEAEQWQQRMHQLRTTQIQQMQQMYGGQLVAPSRISLIDQQRGQLVALPNKPIVDVSEFRPARIVPIPLLPRAILPDRGAARPLASSPIITNGRAGLKRSSDSSAV